MSEHALAFWILFLTATALFFWGQLHIADQAARLEDLIRNLPPKDFLALCAELYRKCFATHDVLKYAAIGGSLGSEEVIQSVRFVLTTFVILAQKFDRSPKARYAANVMLFRESGSIPEADRSLAQERLKFCDPDVTISNLKGILDLRCDLSATSDSPDAPDPKLQPLALPVTAHPHLATPTDRLRLLPGAPRAFFTGNMECYRDTSGVVEQCKTKGDFSPSIQEEIHQYFQNHQMGSYVKSFVSMPLRNPQSQDIFGVLNLHRNEEGMLKDEGLALQFFDVMTPNVLTLERLLAVLVSLESRV